MTIYYSIDDSYQTLAPVSTLKQDGFKIEYIRLKDGFKIVSVDNANIATLTNSEWQTVCDIIGDLK